jgi:hypothetical protein
MPVSAAVISLFVAGVRAVLIWGDFQTRPVRLKDTNPQKRRSF